MPIGLSNGNYYRDEMHYLSSQWDDRYDDNVVSPDKMQTDKSLDQSELNPSTGIGMPVGYKTEEKKELPDFTNQYGTPDKYKLWPERMVSDAFHAMMLPGEAWRGEIDPMSEEGRKRTLDLAMTMIGAPAPVARKLADGTLGSFAGVTSKSIDKGALEVAQDALKQGVHPDEVWQKTGFFKGADDRWRYEIPDSNAKLHDRGFEISEIYDPNAGGEIHKLYTIKDKITNRPTRLPDILDHPELYEAYPTLKNTYVKRLPDNHPSLGMMDIEHNTMWLNKDLDPEYLKGIVLHEAQHMIQKEEGFSRGGNYLEFSKRYGEEQAFELYKRLQGEVEARNVQTRMNMSESELKDKSPRFTEDRPRFVQIPAEQRGPAIVPSERPRVLPDE